MPLVSACKVSEIRSDVHKKRKQFIFKVIWPLEEPEKDESKDGTAPVDGEAPTPSGINTAGPNLLKPIKSASSAAPKKKSSGKKRDDGSDNATGSGNKNMSSTKIAALAVGGVALGAVTAGVGLLAGLLVVGIGAAAGGGAAAFTSDMKEYHLQ